MLLRYALRLAPISLVCASTAASADFFDDVVDVVTAPISVPIETTLDVLQGNDPARSAREAAAAGGRTLNNGVNVAQTVHEQIANVPRDALNRNVGGDWVRAYDMLTASQRVQTEMGFTSGRFLGSCLQLSNCNVNQLMAMPVAASLRDAYKLYSPYGVPLHPTTQSVLMRVIPAQTVANVRIAFGNVPDFTVPGFLNSGHEAFGGGHAVTIGNLIIFSRPLNLNDLYDWNWLLHEIRHAEQYQSYSSNVLESIDGFSGDYIAHYNSMEGDAQNSADARQNQLNQMCPYGC